MRDIWAGAHVFMSLGLFISAFILGILNKRESARIAVFAGYVDFSVAAMLASTFWLSIIFVPSWFALLIYFFIGEERRKNTRKWR